MESSLRWRPSRVTTAAAGLVTAACINLATNTVPVMNPWLVWTVAVLAASVTVFLNSLRNRSKNSGLPVGLNELDAASDTLARETARAWEKEADKQKIDTTAPVMVTWSWDDRYSIPQNEVLPTRNSAGLPQRQRSRKSPSKPRSALLDHGVITALHDQLYSRLERGQLVLVGAAGTGKTGAMLLLLLKALEHRAVAPSKTQSSVPIPVWLTLGSWDPDEVPLAKYAAETMARTFPGLRSGQFGRRVPERLIEDRRIALFLDGLDEMPPAIQKAALTAIAEQTKRLRVVLTSRPDEYKRARHGGRLSRPVVIRLDPVDVETAATYLTQGCDTGEQRQHWKDLADYLRANPGSVAAEALNTPLTLTLARSAYDKLGDNSPKPTELTALPSVEDIKTRLIGRFLDRAYPVEGQPGGTHLRRLRRKRAQALYYLAWIAHRMRTNRDLPWWRIPTWVPAEWLGAACGLALGLVIAVINTLGAGLMTGSTTGLLWYTIGSLLFGIGFGSLFSWRSIGEGPTAMAPRLPTYEEAKKLLRNGVFVALPFGMGIGLRHGPLAGVAVAFGFMVMTVLGADLGDGIAGGLLAAWKKPLADSPATTPRSAYQADRRRTVITVLAGMLVGGLFIGSLGLIDGSSSFGVKIGVGIGAALGFAGGVGPAFLVVVVQFIVLIRRRRWGRLFPILETALKQQVLRQVGVVYQFRHAELQDFLLALYEREYGRSAGSRREIETT